MLRVTVEKERKVIYRRKALVLTDEILADFITVRNKKSLKDLKGKISFSDDYDYKLMRQ